MKDQDRKNGQQRPGGEEELLQTLFRQAGAREKPGTEEERAAREALRAEWQRMVGRRKKRRFATGLALAASLFIAIAVVILTAGGPPAPGPATQLAAVDALRGTVRYFPAGISRNPEPLRESSRLTGGNALETRADSGVALAWVHGQSIRLDENTRVQFESPGDIRLEHGRVYVDTAGQSRAAEGLVILTPAGRVRHVGTQYMTAVAPAGTTVSVRAGRVSLDTSGTLNYVTRGEQLTVSVDGRHQVEEIDTWGEQWEWAASIAPAFDSDGKTIADLIDWVAGETGHEVEYASLRAEEQARQTVLRGQLGLEPIKALEMITQTSGLQARLSGGRIAVSLPEDG